MINSIRALSMWRSHGRFSKVWREADKELMVWCTQNDKCKCNRNWLHLLHLIWNIVLHSCFYFAQGEDFWLEIKWPPFTKKNAYFAKVIKELNVIEISFSRNPYRNSPKGILHSTKKSLKNYFLEYFLTKKCSFAGGG